MVGESTAGPLIGPVELADRLGSVKPLDVRWDLSEPDQGRTAYLEGHIPGAVFVDLDRDLAAQPSLAGRHPLPPAEEFARTLGRLGITPGDEVVAYDDSGGAVAARLWWMLCSIGHRKTRVLDGGYRAWVEEGGPVETGDHRPTPTEYPLPPGFTGLVERDRLEGRVLVDARAPERYRGETEPVDPKAGHIPGAINIPLTSNLGTDGRFLGPAELADIYRDLPERPVVYCGSGVNACHLALGMVVAGRAMPDLYVGSFSEWSRRDLPVDTGP